MATSQIIQSPTLADGLRELSVGDLYLLVDENVAARVAEDISTLSTPPVMGSFPMGEEHKTLDGVSRIWQFLVENGAKRNSVAVCVGGGVTTDMCGFAAATFKRGIEYVNVPTTLLGAVDAAVGGKTAIDFMGLKNEIGAFRIPLATIIVPRFFQTLPKEHILSGYAEMLKTALLDTPEHAAMLMRYGDDVMAHREALFTDVVEVCRVKERIVAEDPLEKGIRKALNLGHTIGHAVESLMMRRNTPITHGHAVMVGLVAEAVISVMRKEMPSQLLYDLATILNSNYPRILITCDDYPALLALMLHDKKNDGSGINFTMLRSPGNFLINSIATDDELTSALDIYRDLTSI